MSMHGWTGSGKNYVSEIIADSLYPDGLSSPFVHTFISQLHFSDQNKVDIYKVFMKARIFPLVKTFDRIKP